MIVRLREQHLWALSLFGTSDGLFSGIAYEAAEMHDWSDSSARNTYWRPRRDWAMRRYSLGLAAYHGQTSRSVDHPGAPKYNAKLCIPFMHTVEYKETISRKINNHVYVQTIDNAQTKLRLSNPKS